MDFHVTKSIATYYIYKEDESWNTKKHLIECLSLNDKIAFLAQLLQEAMKYDGYLVTQKKNPVLLEKMTSALGEYNKEVRRRINDI